MPSPEPTADTTRARSRSPRGAKCSRSASPRRDGSSGKRRSRSRSPPRRPKNYTGFKWKKHDREGDRDEDRKLGRGYKAQDDDEKRRRRERDRDRDWDRPDDKRGGYGRERRDDRDRESYGRRDRSRDRRDRDRDRDRPRRDLSDRDRDRDRKPKDKNVVKDKKPAAPAAAPTGEPMIVVTVNDRLGTKAQVPCFASDTIGIFKAMVASKIGRAPHEIMLKRQGMRPFKDHITLGDYEISNGVQIDLELDTGD